MGMTIKYEIIFHNDWHCGSGLAAGADVDALVIKDKDGLPYVPGKTVKGLVREAVDILFGRDIKGYGAVFGRVERENEGVRSESFFTNAVLGKIERDYILANNAAAYLYRSPASTAIDENGIAESNSLRKIQVTVPCTLYGEIYEVNEDMVHFLEDAMCYIKRMGQWRNRGLGRCTIEVINPKKKGGEK